MMQGSQETATKYPFDLIPLNPPAATSMEEGKLRRFWRKLFSVLSFRKSTRIVSTTHVDLSNGGRNVLENTTNQPMLWTTTQDFSNGYMHSTFSMGAAPSSPQQIPQTIPFPNNLPITNSSISNDPDIYYRHTYSATYPGPLGNGFIDENYSFSYEQSKGHRTITRRNNTIAVSGSNVIRIDNQEIRT
ncbi:hypothetical protein D9756_006483 [Leucocoprinus leucothites]|uniref:Uncharacterized protein n=1 Tax=Leucocoprinus leucothites TaxID=201217 RepID=A0A8H5LGW3_9AGAR|nr:hypothetical protein D9756_006483 [Leucoagaricus leucothites]